MVPRSSKKTEPRSHGPRRSRPTRRSGAKPKFGRLRQLVRKVQIKLKSLQAKIRNFRSQHRHPHKSFRRSYREDYQRPTETPGLLHHAMLTFRTIFQHWRTFLAFVALMTVLYIVTVGLMSEDFYRTFQDNIDETSAELAGGQIGNFAKAGLLLISTITSGGLDTGMGDVQFVMMIILFLMMWLVTIFLLRHFMAGEKPKLRDGLYNALTPLISTFVVFAVIFIQAIPLMLVVITYAAAQMTNFLATPFYALLYFIFASLMILLSGYLLSSSLMALIAVTTPSMYPMKALFASADLMSSRRLRLVLRVFYLLFVVAVIYIITMLPIILIDLGLKNIWTWLEGWPIVPFFMLVVTCFVFIYATTYLYLYYRWLLDYKE